MKKIINMKTFLLFLQADQLTEEQIAEFKGILCGFIIIIALLSEND